MTVFDLLIWGGALLTLAGLLGIVWCIVTVGRAKRAKLEDGAMRARMQKVVAVNMGALGASMIGLMAVVLGVMLGR
ncbi:hypothetical protein KTN05_00775 [Paracoccus sp. Z118]|uniref:hypothetical protein n=1 Tax=Paracoccus sp. Z118 TaxID=2851017 RepID=UPI001C2CBAD6|nr:hypothetical protein [Paracoccus sp. Z118]MBV0890384.1 hypothetical protein [Paracoccus sp. Z118]